MHADPPTEELTWFSWVEDRPLGESPAAELRALTDAIRAHERDTRRGAVPRRPADHVLYRRLTDLD
ncbi:MAG TPA: hypothetical protein VGO66_09345 [Solirubrobacterales bacterium]|jgi:hypothetical protein|nr:hypothetical protein [Solirubrobacterales bacterium]